MGFFEIFLIAIGLSADAFAVSLAKGLATPRYRTRYSVCCGLWFGGFQILMPLLGYALSRWFATAIASYAHWVAFGLLVLIGGSMMREAFGKDEGDTDASYAPLHMLPMAIATAIDAMAVGVTFAFLDVDILPAVCLIGATTFVCSAVGVRIGSIFGEKYAKTAQIVGGLVLIGIGVRTLLSNL